MAKNRVQVTDLEAPQPIRPAPVQSDTFAAPPQPVINNDLERLSAALGYFASGVKAYIDDPERKMALREAQMAEFHRWQVGKTSTEQIDLIKAGKAPRAADPYADAAMKQHYGELHVLKLTDDLDAEVQKGIPDWGTDAFDPEAYVGQRAAKVMQEIGVDPTTAISFGQKVEALKRRFKGAHEAERAKVRQFEFTNNAYLKIDQAVTNGFDSFAPSQDITETLKKVYGELGPRAAGGSLDLRYGQMDDILLEVLEKKAANPMYADAVMKLLASRRMSEDGTSDLSLDTIARHKDKVAAIRTAAVKTMVAVEEMTVKEGQLGKLQAAFLAGDGTYSVHLRDFKQRSTIDPSKTFSMSRSEQEEEVKRRITADTQRTFQAGKGGLDEEVDAFLRNGVAHPTFIPPLQQGYAGFLNVIASGKSPAADQIAQIKAAAFMYDEMATKRGAYAYLEQHLTKDQREFYDAYNTLTRYLGHTDEQAAATLAVNYSKPEGSRSVHLSTELQYDVRDRVRDLDYSWFPFSASIRNQDTAAFQITRMSEALIKFNGIDPKAAVDAATERFETNALHINGYAFMAPGLHKSDEAGVLSVLGTAYEMHKKDLTALGITSPDGLSVMPLGNGTLAVIRAGESEQGFATGIVTVKAGDRDVPLKIDIPSIRAAGAEIVRKGREEAVLKQTEKFREDEHYRQTGRYRQPQAYREWNEGVNSIMPDGNPPNPRGRQ